MPGPGRAAGDAMRARRILAAVVLAAAFLLVQVPAHEYGHCLSYWARGGGICYVRFSAPGDSLPASGDGTSAGAVGQAFVGEAPWWEHPVMYALHVGATIAFGFWLGQWLSRPVRPEAAFEEVRAPQAPARRVRPARRLARQPFGRART